MQRQGLITLQDDELHINPRILARYSCWPQARAKRCNVIHHFLAVERQPVDQPRYAGEKSRTVAQRLSVLHGINAPEFSTRRCSVLWC